jgi:hypothetical protein
MGAIGRPKRVRVFENPKAYRRHRRMKLLRGILKVSGHVVFWVVVVTTIWFILTVIGSPARPK